MTVDPAEFFEGYRRGFEARDAGAIAELFACPVFVIGDDGGSVALRSVPDRGQWVSIIQGLLDSYAAMGVVSVRIAGATSVVVSERIVQVTIRWVLAREDGGEVYGFRAGYTLVREDDGWRIGAVAHDERARRHPR